MTIFDILTNQDFLGAVISTLAVILLSFYLRRKNIIKEEAKSVISGIVLKLGLPAMAFSAFMTDLNEAEFKSNMTVLILGICLYLLLIVSSFLVFKFGFKNVSKDKKDVFEMIIVFGNVTFFTSPIIEGFYGDNIKIPEYLMIVAFRLFLYTYAYFKMCNITVDKKHIGSSMKKFLLNPIMIATVLGLLIWALQNVLPHVEVNGISYCVFRVDKTIPYIYKPVTYLSKMATPLSWILVGATIGEMPFKNAVKNVQVWLMSFVRTIIVPLIVLGIVVLLQYVKVIEITKYGFAAAVLTLSAPLSVVINSYAVDANKETYFVSDTCLISTVMGMITLPVMVIIVELISATSLFL